MILHYSETYCFVAVQDEPGFDPRMMQRVDPVVMDETKKFPLARVVLEKVPFNAVLGLPVPLEERVTLTANRASWTPGRFERLCV